jgi:hypothetical protein
VLKVESTELLSPDLPDGNYRVEGSTSLFSIGDHKEKEGLKEIQISSYNFSLSLPRKLLYGLNFEKLKNFCEKWISGMEVFENLLQVEGDFENEKKILVLKDFCAKNNILSAKIEYLTVRTKHSEQDPNVPLFRNIPVVVLKSPGNKRYWYKKGDVSYLLTTGTLPNSIQKAKALLEQQNREWTTNLTMDKEIER